MKGLHIPLALLVGEDDLDRATRQIRFAMATYGSSPEQALGLVLAGAML